MLLRSILARADMPHRTTGADGLLELVVQEATGKVYLFE
jgi:hypothetical protein